MLCYWPRAVWQAHHNLNASPHAQADAVNARAECTAARAAADAAADAVEEAESRAEVAERERTLSQQEVRFASSHDKVLCGFSMCCFKPASWLLASHPTHVLLSCAGRVSCSCAGRSSGGAFGRDNAAGSHSRSRAAGGVGGSVGPAQPGARFCVSCATSNQSLSAQTLNTVRGLLSCGCLDAVADAHAFRDLLQVTAVLRRYWRCAGRRRSRRRSRRGSWRRSRRGCAPPWLARTTPSPRCTRSWRRPSAGCGKRKRRCCDSWFAGHPWRATILSPQQRALC